MSDPRKYRTKKEEEEYQNSDPIAQVLKVIRSNKYLTEKQIETVYAETKKTIQESVNFAEESPYPKPEDIYQDVYDQEDYPFIVE